MSGKILFGNLFLTTSTCIKHILLWRSVFCLDFSFRLCPQSGIENVSVPVINYYTSVHDSTNRIIDPYVVVVIISRSRLRLIIYPFLVSVQKLQHLHLKMSWLYHYHRFPVLGWLRGMIVENSGRL